MTTNSREKAANSRTSRTRAMADEMEATRIDREGAARRDAETIAGLWDKPLSLG